MKIITAIVVVVIFLLTFSITFAQSSYLGNTGSTSFYSGSSNTTFGVGMSGRPGSVTSPYGSTGNAYPSFSVSNASPNETIPLYGGLGLYGGRGSKNPYGEGNPFPPGTPPNPYGYVGILSGFQ